MYRTLIFIFSFFAVYTFAQRPEAVNYSDTLNCNELLRLSETHRASNPYASAYYAEKAIRLGTRKNQLDAVVRGNILLGILLEEKNNTADAYKYYQHAIKIATEIKDSSLISQCYRSIGVIYKRLELFEKSIDYLSKALKYAENSKKDLRQLIGCRNVIGHVYMDWFDKTKNKAYFESAIKTYSSANDLCRIHKRYQAVSHGYANLANAWMLRYKNFNDAKDIKKSLSLSYHGLNFSLSMNHPDWTPIHYINIGEANYYSGYNDSAIIYYKKALLLHKKLNNQGWFEAIHRDMALAYKAKGDHDNAIKYIKEAIDDGMRYHATASADNYRILSELYSLKQDYIQAFDAYKRYKERENMDINSKRTLQLERLQIEYDNTIKDREIEYLNQKKTMAEEKLSKNRLFNLLIIISLALVVFVCVFLFINSKNLKRSKELSDNARIMQEQFLANTSHEIRTPMNGIQGMVNLLLDSPLNQAQRQQLETIKTSSNHLLRIINDLLDLSKIKAGKIEFVKNTFEIAPIINLIRELMLPSAEHKGLKLKFRIDPSAEGFFLGDDIRLEQILINLVSNAVKYTEEGEIDLFVHGEANGSEKKLVFKISDSGIGIPKKKLGIIFESFVQLENAGRRKQGGAGLGLSITKQLVELQKGSITVNSTPGKGSEFLFWIPYEMASSRMNQSEAHGKLEKRDLQKKKILVIEDNEINQKVVSNTLRSWNAEAAIVSTAVEGFDLLMNKDFDLILMDIELPVINGWDATQYIRLKFDAPKKNIPVIALTAYASEDDKNKCYSSGMNEIVTKPFNSQELYAKIYNFLFHPGESLQKTYMKESSHHEENFAELEMKYKEDRSGLLEIYGLFLSELPVYVEELKALNELGNLEGVRKQAHKMKSPIGLIGSITLLDYLNRLQQKEILSDAKTRNEYVEFVIKETSLLQNEIAARLGKLEESNS
jgi:signal transduction histidine kinase/CheY-like chemotaxis protein